MCRNPSRNRYTRTLETGSGESSTGIGNSTMGWLSLCSVMIVNRSFPRSKTTQKDFFYGSSDPIRLSLPLLPDPVFTADYKKMKLFQLSILWRAAEATGEFFSAVILPTHHRERLRQMLLTENPGADHEYFCTMARLVASPVALYLNRF